MNNMNIDLTNKTIKILNHCEILQENDMVRLIVETSYEGNGFDLTYKRKGYNPLNWQPANEELSGWIGERISDFSYHSWYEYARIIE